MRTFLRAVLIALLVSLLAVVQADDQRLVAKSNGAEPIIHFTRLHYRVADVQEHQELSVYADGRVRVQTPSYMKMPGTYEYRLSAKAMQSVLGKLQAHGLMTFDQESARAQKVAEAEERSASFNERFHVSDLTETQITLNFASFGSAGAKGKSVQNRIVWSDLPADAMRYAKIEAIGNLAKAEQILLGLTDHSRRNATRVSGGQ